MPRPTKDNEIEDLQELREIAERDPMKALEQLLGKVLDHDPKEEPPTQLTI